MRHRFGKRLRLLRKLQGMNQSQLAETLDVTPEFISRIERGVSTPSFKFIANAARALETDPANLFLPVNQPLVSTGADTNGFTGSVGLLSRLGSWEMDLGNGSIQCSDSIFPIFGCQPGEADPSFALLLKRTHPDDAAVVEGTWRGIMTGNPSYNVIFRIIRKDREVRHLIVSAEVEFDGDGPPTRAFGTLADITESLRLERFIGDQHVAMEERVRERTSSLRTTIERLGQEIQERKKVEKALRESENRFRSLFELLSEGVMLTGRNGEVVHANSSVLRMLGYSLNEIKELNVRELIHPDNLAARPLILRQDHPVRLERRYRTKQGGDLPVEITVTHHPGLGLHQVMFHDISGRRQAENELKAHLAFMRALLNAIPIPVFWRDKDNRYLGCNRAYEDFYGLEQGEIVGRGPAEFHRPENAEYILGKDRELLDNGVPQRLDAKLTDLNGEPRDVIISKAVYRDAEGRTAGIVGAFIDVTDLKRAEECLAKAKQEWEAIFDAVPDRVYVTDREYRVVRANQATAAWLGMPVREIVGKRCFELVHGESSPPEFCPHQQVLRNREPVGQEVYLGKSKEHVRFLAMPFVTHRGLEGTLHVVRDITARRKAELALMESERELRELYQNATVGLFRSTPEGRFLHANGHLAQMLGYASPQEMVHGVKDIASEIWFVPSDRERLLHQLDRQERVHSLETRLKHTDGAPLWAEESIRAVRDASGRVQYYEGFVVDISERKRAEALREDFDRLFRHDLRTPLSGIMQVPGLLRREGNLTPMQEELLQAVEDASYKMLGLVSISLELHKMEEGRFELSSAPFDLLQVVRRAVKLLGPVARGRGASVDIRVRGSAPAKVDSFFIEGDENLCFSMASNLAKNALEAAPKDSRVRIDLDDRDKVATMAFHNQGEVPETVREDFFAKYSTAGKPHGMGLGTYSARLIARAHGGDIHMATSKAEGTTITVTLPLIQDR